MGSGQSGTGTGATCTGRGEHMGEGNTQLEGTWTGRPGRGQSQGRESSCVCVGLAETGVLPCPWDGAQGGRVSCSLCDWGWGLGA